MKNDIQMTFTLDYICVDDCALKSVQIAYILEREEVVESDHAAVGVDVEWKVKRRRKARGKNIYEKKRELREKEGQLLINGMSMGAKWSKEIIKICLV